MRQECPFIPVAKAANYLGAFYPERKMQTADLTKSATCHTLRHSFAAPK
jgi:hypothetical protein